MDKITQKNIGKIHGGYDKKEIIATCAASEFKGNPAGFELGNPLTSTGSKVLTSMKKNYGVKKGKQVFYSSMNKGKKGSSSWHK